MAVDFTADKAPFVPNGRNRCRSRPQVRIEKKIPLFGGKLNQPFDALHIFNRGVVNSVFLLPYRIIGGLGISGTEPTAIEPKPITLFWLFYPFNKLRLFKLPSPFVAEDYPFRIVGIAAA